MPVFVIHPFVFVCLRLGLTVKLWLLLPQLPTGQNYRPMLSCLAGFAIHSYLAIFLWDYLPLDVQPAA